MMQKMSVEVKFKPDMQKIKTKTRFSAVSLNKKIETQTKNKTVVVFKPATYNQNLYINTDFHHLFHKGSTM